MRILSCIAHDHNPWLVLLAAIMCLFGALVSAILFRRTLAEKGAARLHWAFLSAVTAGAATWATHFIAMLGYTLKAPVTINGVLTVVSALIAVIGIGLGLKIATRGSRGAVVVSGATIGLSMAAMHYVGMFAYEVEGIVEWDAFYVVISLLISCGLGIVAMQGLFKPDQKRSVLEVGGCLAAAIIGMHFVGMTAFSVTPIAGLPTAAETDALAGMAASIGMVALLIVGTGISTYLIERKTNEESEIRIAHIATHDTLTNLANRHQFGEALQQECERRSRYGRPFSLMMVDLDRFKTINDTLGHPVGDIVLKRAAHRLVSAVREGDLVARMGADEFGIISRGASDMETAQIIAERVIEVLSRPYVINGNVIELTGSLGFALSPEHGQDPKELIQHVEVALYASKHDENNGFRAFEPQLMDEIRRARSLEASLRRASMREEFTLVYQPVFEARTGRLTGAETLLRWTCPDHGVISPAEFIPLAEDLGLVSRIGTYVLGKACKDAASWPEEVHVAVNVSPVQLLDPRLPQIVASALSDAGLDPRRLELEITETALLTNDEAALRTLSKIRELGVSISLDDFGTGYSSLSYLHRFPISRIKIDRSFVQQLPDDIGSASIVRAIAQLGNSLGMQITAEGIETEAQLSVIRDYGCDHVQGFLTGRPQEGQDFIALARRSAVSAAA